MRQSAWRHATRPDPEDLVGGPEATGGSFRVPGWLARRTISAAEDIRRPTDACSGRGYILDGDAADLSSRSQLISVGNLTRSDPIRMCSAAQRSPVRGGHAGGHTGCKEQLIACGNKKKHVLY